MKGELYILVGISNSGKSTHVAKLVQNAPDTYTRVNRNDIRALAYGYTDSTINEYYKRKDLYKLEKEVTRIEDTLIYEGLEAGKTVIVDSTNLKRKYLERYKYWNVPTDILLFPVTLKEALTRNMGRSRQVGEEVIKTQYNRFVNLSKDLRTNPIDFTPVILNNDPAKTPVVVYDIDGCLAHHDNKRSPYDWHSVGHDRIDDSLSLINKNSSLKSIIATGRDGVCLPETEQWLENNSIKYDEIYIRPKGDFRPDWLIKQEITQSILKDNHIVAWYDDRLQVTRHLRMLGLSVYNVAHGNF